MDKRQQKTRAAIFHAFTELLNSSSYNVITVQNIIDQANIGRSTFYAHFDTKEALLQALCGELFDHIISTAMDVQDTHGLYSCSNASSSMFCHILQHLQENDNNILSLLTCESNGLFIGYFKRGMERLVGTMVLQTPPAGTVPRVFLINHIAGSFVEMVQWWLQNGRRQSPEELDECFRAVIEPIIQG